MFDVSLFCIASLIHAKLVAHKRRVASEKSVAVSTQQESAPAPEAASPSSPTGSKLRAIPNESSEQDEIVFEPSPPTLKRKPKPTPQAGEQEDSHRAEAGKHSFLIHYDQRHRLPNIATSPRMYVESEDIQPLATLPAKCGPRKNRQRDWKAYYDAVAVPGLCGWQQGGSAASFRSLTTTMSRRAQLQRAQLVPTGGFKSERAQRTRKLRGESDVFAGLHCHSSRRRPLLQAGIPLRAEQQVLVRALNGCATKIRKRSTGVLPPLFPSARGAGGMLSESRLLELPVPLLLLNLK
eukprot:SAG31_NODE_1647_length_7645_cov_47.639544_11_plen_294_part_00